MYEHHRMRDTLIEIAAASSGATAIAAFFAAVLALLSGEFIDTRLYLLALALVSALVAYVLDVRLSRCGAPGRR